MRHVVDDMTKRPLVTATEQMPVVEAWRKMRDAGVRHLPVLDNKKQIVGILSDRDLWRAADATLSHCRVFADLSVAFDTNSVVGQYMTRNVRFVHADQDLKSVVRTMIDEKISSLIVRDSVDQSLAGIITTEDLLRVLHQYLKKDSGEEDSMLRIERAMHDSPVGWLAGELSNTGI